LSESCQVCILKRAHEWVIHENDSKHQARASLQADCPVAVIKLYQVGVYHLLPVATKCDAMIKNGCSSLENCSQANTNVRCSQGGESEVLNLCVTFENCLVHRDVWTLSAATTDMLQSFLFGTTGTCICMCRLVIVIIFHAWASVLLCTPVGECKILGSKRLNEPPLAKRG